MTRWLALRVLLLALVLGCRARIGTSTNGNTRISVGDDDTSETTKTSPGMPPAETVGIPRTRDSDFAAVQQVLDATLGFPTALRARKGIPGTGPPFLDFVVFEVEGADYCASQPRDCATHAPSTWEMLELLGLAVVGFEDPTHPFVIGVRLITGDIALTFDSVPEHELAGKAPVGGDRSEFNAYADVVLDALDVVDVDGDGKFESLIVFSYTTLEGDPWDSDVMYELFARKRLIVAREDLSFQLSMDVHQEMDTAVPLGVAPNDRVRESYSFDPWDRSLVLEWCEITPSMTEDCPLDVVCSSPTLRTRIPYDPGTDSYPKAKLEQLRPPVEAWDDRCL